MGLDIAQLPGNQNAQEHQHRDPDPHRERPGHALVAGAILPTAAHHEDEGRCQAGNDDDKGECDDDLHGKLRVLSRNAFFPASKGACFSDTNKQLGIYSCADAAPAPSAITRATDSVRGAGYNHGDESQLHVFLSEFAGSVYMNSALRGAASHG